MFGIINFDIFLISSAVLVLTPGADTMYTLGRSTSQGKKAGIISALGSAAGGMLHCLLAGLGLSIILAESSLIFGLVKFLGGAYLIFLGAKSIVKGKTAKSQPLTNNLNTNYNRIFISGALTNVLNPKVALFFLSFLPQFVHPEFLESPKPFLILGSTFLLMGTLWCLIIAITSSRVTNLMGKSKVIQVWLDRIAGIIFISLGAKILLSKS